MLIAQNDDPGLREWLANADRDRGGIEVRPFAGGELRARSALVDAANPERGILDLEIRPVAADARRPAAVGRAVDPLVQDGLRARVLDGIAAMPEAAFLVEPQPALLA